MATTTKTFNSSDIWVCPPRVTSIQVEAWGAGGAGGGRTTNGGGGGGGGGQYAKNIALTVTSGNTYTVTVGAQTAVGTGNGATGGNSSFNVTDVIAVGGGGGGGGAGSAEAGGIGGTGGTGTVLHDGGGGGQTTIATDGGGGGGEGGGKSATGGAGGDGTVATGGTGGTGTEGGNGAAGTGVAQGIGVAGTAPGGGGGGSYSTAASENGGAGAAGQVILTYTTPLLEYLVDSFNNNIQNTAQWVLEGPGTPSNQIKFVNNQIEITTDAIANDYFDCGAIELYDLTASSAQLNLVSAGAQLANQDCIPIFLALDGSNELWWDINGGTIASFKKVAGAQATINTATYSSSTHKWLRIREAGGTIFWDYGSDGRTWINFSTLATPFAITALQPGLQGGQFGAAASTTFKYDNFNFTGVSRLALLGMG